MTVFFYPKIKIDEGCNLLIDYYNANDIKFEALKVTNKVKENVLDIYESRTAVEASIALRESSIIGNINN